MSDEIDPKDRFTFAVKHNQSCQSYFRERVTLPSPRVRNY